ncbi:RlpA-like double-psi beta-barrel-protein domain-containing protein-containing protein [Trametes elegans]|nr:RlpA-like double-psi beta-barrel-protein domain-containing protein-containing protein [Trametes elegans]
MFSLSAFTLLALALPFTALASSHGQADHRRHEAIAAHINDNTTETSLARRGEDYKNVRLTFYDVGLGACGQYNQPSDFIVALSSQNYGGGYPGPHCFKMIEITCNGKTTQAQIMDECPGCDWGGLDLSRGLFQFFDSLDKGVLTADWHYVDDPPAQPTSSKWVEPTSTWQEPSTTWQEPTSTWSPPPETTSSTWSPPPEPSTTSTKKHSSTSSSTWSSSSETPSSSSSSWSSSSAASSSSVAPAALASASASASAGPDTLAKLNQAFLGLAEVALAGAAADN